MNYLDRNEYVISQYKKKQKKTHCTFFWQIFCLHYFYLRKPGLGILFILLILCQIGCIWWFIDLFRIKKLTEECNEDIMIDIVAKANLVFGKDTNR